MLWNTGPQRNIYYCIGIAALSSSKWWLRRWEDVFTESTEILVHKMETWSSEEVVPPSMLSLTSLYPFSEHVVWINTFLLINLPSAGD